jgi:tRNA threonylcarbamoyl adenosine modification protein YjeE
MPPVDFTSPTGSVTVADPADMRDLGRDLGRVLQAGDVVVLTGPLGAGKTTLTQGLAEGLGVLGRAKSPTFTIVREHRPADAAQGGRGIGLLHMDAYRLLGDAVQTAVGPRGARVPRETVLDILESLDIDAELGDRVLVAEWGRGVVETLSERVIDVEIDREAGVGDGDGPGDLVDAEPRRVRWSWLAES